MKTLIKTLQDIVGASHVLDSTQVAKRAKHFWDPSPMQAKAMVKPASTAEVSQVLKACYAAEQTVVTQGGLTGLADGEKSDADDIILSLERMNAIESLDAVNRTMTVQAGCILETVHAKASSAGLLYGLDLGARGSCTIGGNISTNAGGLSVLRYGMTRDQILGLEVVLADGTLLTSMNALIKNNSGYDLKQLFIGSEGSLGVVTRAVLRLRPDTPTRNTAIVAFDNFQQVTDTLAHVSVSLNATLNAFEIIWNEFYTLSTNQNIAGTSRAPLSNSSYAYAIIETRGSSPQADQNIFSQTLEQALEQDFITDAVIAQSEAESKNIWKIRENVDITLRHQPLFVYDISLPINTMPTYLNQLQSEITTLWPDAVLYAYGHLADGNLHISIAPTPEKFIQDTQQQMVRIQTFDDIEKTWYEQCNRLVFEPLTQIGGSISAEHGIGLLKKRHLHYSRNATEISTMQLLKNTLDPKNLLNRGKIFEN